MATRKSTRTSSASSSSMAIHQIAKAVDLSSKELRATIDSWELGWDTSSHMKKLAEEQIRELEKRLDKRVLDTPAPKKAAPKKAAASSESDKPAKPRRSRRKSEDAPAQEKAAPAAEAAPSAEESKPAKPRRSRKKSDEAPAKEEAAPAAKDAASDEKSKPAKPRRSRKKKTDDAPANQDAAPTSSDDAASEEPRDLVAEGRAWLRQTLLGMGMTHPRVEGREDGNRLEFNIRGADAVELIGQRNASARTDLVDALQSLLHRALFGSSRGNIVVIDVLNFRQERVDELSEAAASAAAFVRSSGKTMRFAAMNSFDRRAMHLALGDERGVRAESVGQGLHRQLELSPAGRGKANAEEPSKDAGESAANDDASNRRKSDDEGAKKSDGRRGRGRRPKRDDGGDEQA